jgi:hypothetical protein
VAANAAEPVVTLPAMGILPAEGLKPDTRIAAGADRSQIGYLGVWAPDFLSCGAVDQSAEADFLVVTPISIRRGPRLPDIVTAVPATDGKIAVTVGETSYEIVQLGSDTITLNGEQFVRCTTP